MVSSPQGLHITDLPDGIFADVAKYLAKPSIACFGVAMTAPSESESRQLSNNAQMNPSSLCKAILTLKEGDSWEVLDFGDESLAAKLSDDDVHSILAHIDAINKLKTLKLTGCVNITGSGLSPLGGSDVLKEIDLSLVGQHQNLTIVPEPKISEEVVLPILNSIVSAEGTLIEFIRLPKVWRERRIPQMDQFIESFNRLETSRNHKCTQCKVLCRERSHLGLGDGLNTGHDSLYGSQNFSCNICRRFFCYECETENGVDCLKYCGRCEVDYCSGCNPVKNCDRCQHEKCSKCSTIESCTNCGDSICDDCADKCDCRSERRCEGCAGYDKCEYDGCKRVHCDDCREDKNYNVEFCDTCDETYCSECRYLRCSKDVATSCPNCLKMIAGKLITKLVEENKLIPELKEENEQLRTENEELKKKLHTRI